MSRYYDISIYQPGPLNPSTPNIPLRTWTSHPNGVYDPNAWNVEFDILAYDYAEPAGASTISIEGPSLEDLAQHISYAGNILNSFSGMTLQLKGGMHQGLPLSNPKQAGILTTGNIFQSFGNWEGTDQTLDFVIMPAGKNTFQQPGNFMLDWKPGTSLNQAVRNTLTAAMPGFTILTNFSPAITTTYEEKGYWATLEQFAKHIKTITKGYFSAQYPGVSISLTGSSIVCFDATVTSPPIQIDFNDLIGQPTWIDYETMQMKLVLRGDLHMGSYIKMPQKLLPGAGFVTTLANSLPSYAKHSAIFQGTFNVISLRHIGTSRSADGAQWVSIVNCIPAVGIG